MDISVIVPIYGVEKYIEHSLKSLFSQTKTEGVEYILVNDCTKDRSMEIARRVVAEYPNLNIVTIDLPENSGIAVARQTGLCAARGEYVICYDPDDWCEPEMLGELYNKAKQSDADAVICDYYVNYPRKQLYKEQKVLTNDNLDVVKMMLDGRLNGYLWNKLVKREQLLDNSISFAAGVNMMEDLLVNVKLFCKIKNFTYLNKAYLHYQQHTASITNSFSENKLYSMLYVVGDIDKFITENNLGNSLGQAFLFFKLLVKHSVLSGVSRANQKEYVKLFPETDSEIWNTPIMPTYYKFALHQAVRGRLVIANFIYMMIRFIKKIVR